MQLDSLLFTFALIIGGLSLLQLPSSRRRRTGAVLLFLAVLAGSAVLFGLSTSATIKNQQAKSKVLPIPERPGGYVGSNRCQACHPREYASWHESYHRTMTQVATPDT